MTELVLKKIGKHFGVDPWLESKNDYLVLNDAGRIIGRIVKRTCSPNGRPWVWTITVRELTQSFFDNHGLFRDPRTGDDRFQGAMVGEY